MSTLLHRYSEPMTAGARPAFSVRVAQAAVGLLRAWRNRRAIQRLGEMSDYELADIGVTRADLHVAFHAPAGRDPTAELGAIAEARAFARQEAARRIC